ncbi:MAG: P-type DNA transfer ATPase VirB11 [Gammaproteobacteria bacterium]|nr:P-type DNA transfer ATPase VirB11 [Gammaproteobacteria bacterium]
MNHDVLNVYLEPIRHLLTDESVNEIIVNRPGEVWVEWDRKFERIDSDEFSAEHLRTLADLVASSTHQTVDESTPLLSATLPDGCRAQFVLPPACPSDAFVMAVRRHRPLNFTLEDYEAAGAFDSVGKRTAKENDVHGHLSTLYKAGNISGFIRCAIENRVSCLISGGTSTGKTTFLRTCLSLIPSKERLVLIEDVPEIFIEHDNVASLLYSRNDQGVANVTPQQLLEASLRLRPDRIILGELRGNEAAAYLSAINSGHSGSITSVHADNPYMAYDKVAQLVMQSGMLMSKAEIIEYVKNIIPVVIQWDREDDRLYVQDIYHAYA